MHKHIKKIFSLLKGHKTLTAILILAALLRFYNLANNPVSPYWDEVSIGYNAYSISQTGKDEWGEPLPLLFKAFGEYKLPGQIYLTVPFVKILGLNDFSIRLPSAVMGILAVFAIYLLTSQLAQKITSSRYSHKIALFSALLLAISPWHLQFSRAAFEANSAISLYAFGLYFLYSGLKKPRNYIYAAIIFGLSFYFYYHVRIIIPLIAIYFSIAYFKLLFKNLRTISVAVIFFLIITLPIIYSAFTPQALKRSEEVSIIDITTPQTNPDFVKAYAKYQNLSVIPNNFKDKLAWTDVLFEYYLRHLDFNFLFTTGDPHQPRHSTTNHGLLYYFQIPLLLTGLFLLIRKHSKESIFVIFLGAIFPLSAIFSDLTPHALRSSLGSFNLSLLSAFGMLPFLKQRIIKSISIIIITLSVGFYLFQYHAVAPKTTSQAWGYGHKELFTYLQPHTEPIIISGAYWNPYIYFLYYNHINPSDYQKLDIKKTHFTNYFFAGADWDGRGALSNNLIKSQLQAGKNILVLTPTDDLRITIFRTLLHTIYDKNNSPIFLIYETYY